MTAAQYNSSVALYKTSANLQSTILSFFRTNLASLYTGQIANVSFISQSALINGRYGLKFRLYFLKPITNVSIRTDVVSNIQTTYYGMLKQCFATFAKSIQIPTVKITAPKAASCVTKKAVITSTSNSIGSVLANLKTSLTQVTAQGALRILKGLSSKLIN